MNDGMSTRAGMVAVVGRANVGKSTLINRFLDEKVSIVSPVAQTTRNLIRGILTEPRGQIVFLDTPGVHRAQSDLGRVMNRVARKAVEGVDVVLLVVDASGPVRLEDDGWMRRLICGEEAVVVTLNKQDLEADTSTRFRDQWEILSGETEKPITPDWFSTSARDGCGVPELLDHLFTRMPIGPHLFPEDVLTDFPRKLTVADAVREQYFHVLQEELPHSVAVWIEDIDETSEGWNVHGIIYVQRHSQKGIVLGAKGRLLRRVRRAAEKTLAEMYGQPVSLQLWVKVEKNWTKNFWLLKKFGYV